LKARIAASLLALTLLGLSLLFPASSVASPLLVYLNSARYETLGFYSGVMVNATNPVPYALNLVIFTVWANDKGETLAVTTAGLTLAGGANGIAFAPLLDPPTSGHYVVLVFVWTTSGAPVSGVMTLSLYIV